MRNKKPIYLLCLIFTSAVCFPYSVYGNNETFSLNYIDDCYLNVGYHINIEENYAFVADNDGISVIDISDPTDISRLTIIDFPSAVFGLQIIGNFAYVGGSNAGFYILDITDIYNPITLGHHNHTGAAIKVFIQDDFAFVTDYFSGLSIYDISNKSDPIFEYHYIGVGSIWDVVVLSDVAYIANPYSVEVLNVTDPTSPVQIMTLSNTYDATHLSISGDKLFVGKHGQGLSVYDISVPTTPILLGSYSDDDGGEELGLRGNDTFLCVADNYGIELFDLTSLPTITKLAEYRDGVGAAHDLEFVGNYIYAVDGETGIFVLEIVSESDSTSESNFLLLTGLIATMSLISIKRRRK
ncbi:MAG: LVIVD repeat-containing protein [Candidatus Heimdallarchaeaceae archaeon]